MTRGVALAGLAAAALWLGCAGATHLAGSWRLVPAESELQFTGTKNETVGVPGTFREVDGSFDASAGTGSIEIKLASVDTGDAARDENIRTHFFEAAKFPVAMVNMTGLSNLEWKGSPADKMLIKLEGTVSLHGATVPIKMPAMVLLTAPDKFVVQGLGPIVLLARDFGMESQLATLKAVCGHKSLSGTVPVEFRLTFSRAD